MGTAEIGTPDGASRTPYVAASDEPVMVFGTCELTSTQLQTGDRRDLLEVLMRHGVKRLTAERILEIHCGGDSDATTGRARAHATSRSGGLR